MDGAALFALIAAVGFGWQPMPDGSERYEYIVQVDEDLAATLAAGESIPIVGEVPEDIGPIGRVRVVVGPGDVPRERLVTRLKPVSDQSIVVRGQNATSPYNPYGNSSQAAQPLAAAAEAATEQWNNGVANAVGAPAPSGQALFDSATTAAENAWNQNVAQPAANALNTAGQNLQQQFAAPVQEGINNAATQLQQNIGQGVQGAAASLGDRTKGLLDELGRPLTPQPAQTARDIRRQAPSGSTLATVPPPSTGSAAATNPAANGASQPVTNWNTETPTVSNPLRTAVPATTPTVAGGNDWNNGGSSFPTTPPLASEVASNMGNPAQGQQPLTSSQPPAAAAGNEWNNAGTMPVPALNPTGGNQGVAAADPWRGVADPRETTAPNGAAPPLNLADGPTAPYRGADWPTDAAVVPPPLNVGHGLSSNPPSLSPPNAATPTVTQEMLNQAANRPLDGLAGTAPSGSVPVTNASTTPATTPAAVDDIFTKNRPHPTTPTTPANQQPPAGNVAGTTPTQPAAADGGRDNGFIALVAWVLLFGSAFGNLYLFWSYLDVRQKYRSLVRKTARAVGSRFSAA